MTQARREPLHKMTVGGGDVVREDPRETRVRARVSVLVVGGGPAGVGAALAAAGEGASTLLIERHGMLGGMWTAGLVNPFFEAQRNGWIVRELVDRLKAAGAWERYKSAHSFDPEVMKRELERMMDRAGAAFLYHMLCVDTIVQDGAARGVIVESKGGREAILADVIIDCTGDGDVAARAGAPFEFGRLGDGLVQPMTLMFQVGGIGGAEPPSIPDLYEAMLAAMDQHDLDYELPFGRVNYTPAMIALPTPGAAAVQLTHVYRLNPLDPADVTIATVDARRQAAEAVDILQHIPGLAGLRLGQTAPHIGIRETRRILGNYQLSLEDLVAGRRFEDAVAVCGFGVDIHDPEGGASAPPSHGARIKPYEIPYRCLAPRDVTGLLVAGRCISGTHEAHASYRVTGTCVATGQAAGLAAAWAAGRGVLPGDIPGKEVRRGLAERGVGFLSP